MVQPAPAPWLDGAEADDHRGETSSVRCVFARELVNFLPRPLSLPLSSSSLESVDEEDDDLSPSPSFGALAAAPFFDSGSSAACDSRDLLPLSSEDSLQRKEVT
jgi:hypothetical protein